MEAAISLDATKLKWAGVLDGKPGFPWSWIAYREGSISGFNLCLQGSTGEARSLRLSYTASGGGKVTSLEYPIELEVTPCGFGGGRWWFRCPHIRTGVAPCGRRCRVLHLPPAATRFACRECHALTYASRQGHRDRIYEGYLRPQAVQREAVRRLDRLRSPAKRAKLLAKALKALQAMEEFNGWFEGTAIRLLLDKAGRREARLLGRLGALVPW